MFIFCQGTAGGWCRPRLGDFMSSVMTGRGLMARRETGTCTQLKDVTTLKGRRECDGVSLKANNEIDANRLKYFVLTLCFGA